MSSAELTFSSEIDEKSVHTLTAAEHEFRGIASAYILILLAIYLLYSYLRFKRHTLTEFGEKPAEARKLEPMKRAFL